METNLLDPEYSVEWWELKLRDSLTKPYEDWDSTLKNILTPPTPSLTKKWENLQEDDWPIGRRIPAQVIRKVLLSPSSDKVPDAPMDPQGIFLSGLYIMGMLDIPLSSLPCALSIHNSQFQHRPYLFGANIPFVSFRNCILPGIQFSQARIGNNLDLEGIISSAPIKLNSVEVHGLLILDKAKLKLEGDNSLVHMPENKSVDLDQAHIHGNSFCRNAHLEGSFWANNAHFENELNLTGSRIGIAPIQKSVSMDGAVIEGHVNLSRTHVMGTIWANSTKIHGQLKMQGAIMQPRIHDHALHIDGSHIEGHVVLREAFATGCIWAPSATMGQQLQMDDAFIRVSPDQCALNISSTRIKGDTLLRRVMLVGSIMGRSSFFEGTLHVDTATVRSASSAADFSGSTISILRLTPTGKLEQNGLQLANTSIGLIDDPRVNNTQNISYPENAQGWSVKSMSGIISMNRKAVMAWLCMGDVVSQKKGLSLFSGQSWREIARVYDVSGQHVEAKRLRFEAAKGTTQSIPRFFPKLARRVGYGLTVGYGYRPLYGLLWLIVFATASSLVVLANMHEFVPAHPERITCAGASSITGATAPDDLCGYRPFEPLMYALSVSLPVSISGSTLWVINNPLLHIGLLLVKSISWALSALILAGITGILRKE